MPLRSEIRALRDDTVAALAAAHNHFAYTKKLWRIAGVEVRRHGRRIVLSNPVTGSRLTEADLVAVAQASAGNYLPSAAIQQFVSLTEAFLTDLVRLWLSAFPAHLKGQVDVREIVAAPDKAAILRPLIDQHILSMSYQRPSEWFKRLHALVNLAHPTPDEIARFAEFKATRDVIVHNRGVATAIYLDKAGALARAPLGQPLDLPDAYLHDAWRLCGRIVKSVGTEAAAKA